MAFVFRAKGGGGGVIVKTALLCSAKLNAQSSHSFLKTIPEKTTMEKKQPVPLHHNSSGGKGVT